MGQGLQNEKEKGEKMDGTRGDDGGPRGRSGRWVTTERTGTSSYNSFFFSFFLVVFSLRYILFDIHGLLDSALCSPENFSTISRCKVHDGVFG